MALTNFNEDDISVSDVEYTTNFVIDSATAASARNIYSFVAEASSTGFLVNAQGSTTTTPLSSAFRHFTNYYFSSASDASIPLAQDNTTTTGIFRAIQLGRTTVDDGILSGSVTAIFSFGAVGNLQFVDIPDTTIDNSIGRKGTLVQKNDETNVVGTVFYDTGTLVFHGGNTSTNFLTSPASGFIFGEGSTAETIAINEVNFKSVNSIKRTSFFCRAKNREFNYTNNITALSDRTTGSITGSLTADPTTFITTIGLYNDDGEMLAIAKVSPAVKKTFDTEKVFSVRIQY